MVLASGYEGGFQPISLGTAASWLSRSGITPVCVDTFVDGIDEAAFANADLVAVSVQMFQSIAPAIEIAETARRVNPSARIVMFGAHANIHAERLLGAHCTEIVRGDWEPALVAAARQSAGEDVALPPELSSAINAGQPITVNIQRSGHMAPSRAILPGLQKYTYAEFGKFLDGGKQPVVGNIETARGCHHSCSYCSVFAATGTKVNFIPIDIVMQDIRQVVEMGATHICFIDAEFINSKRHGIEVVRRMKAEFPSLTFDITTRADHILESKNTIVELNDLGCRFITTAMEFPTQRVLDAVNKDLTLDHIEGAIAYCSEIGAKLNATFILFNPWVSLEDLLGFDQWLDKTGLGETIDPVQFTTRLYLYKGSHLLSNPEVRKLQLVEHDFHYEWKHSDPRVDELFAEMTRSDDPAEFKRCCIKC
ncbi:radical SAM protein [Bradyrhizobium diazoefficiens]|nr:RCCLKC-tail radical SAM protein [Bradyrhizobium diazoefficiens]MBR0965667.1 radical SAM protein [Bradyrhizobium diazoefficiens]MBR0979359.1 radical SAM protein [Bradyrhizobium diazoefficiens]MBR1008551.1 radical SAM protein [Bradyrhizobium diazoefficiens]MBR1014700.1 radical SAM protein [Bradyrhizobium diazoefficiens]MBR1052512.1 radical SAM protein [Bradyrhizobium diazoefficiens]